MAKQYFTLLSHSTNPKNKLQEAIWDLFTAESNRVTDDLELFVVRMKNSVVKLCQQFPRCQEMLVSENRYDHGSVTLYVRLKGGDQGPGLNFTFYQIKK